MIRKYKESDWFSRFLVILSKPKISGEVCQTHILREGGVWEQDAIATLVGSSIGVINAPLMENVGVINAPPMQNDWSAFFNIYCSQIHHNHTGFHPEEGGPGDHEHPTQNPPHYFLLMQNLNRN